MHRLDLNRLPRHVSIIMDGNGRWANLRLANRVFGHNEGANSVREVVKCCLELGIPYLTLYAFSKENWQRPESEVTALWHLLRRFLKSEFADLVSRQIRVRHLGDPDDIPLEVLTELRHVVEATADFDRLVLSLAINYGGRQEILRAARKYAGDVLAGRAESDALSQEEFSRYLFTTDLPDPDLIIRTGGEYRVSNFLLWQLAYAELYITATLWPDFREPQFHEALAEFQRRERRFGKTSDQLRTVSFT